LQTHGVSSALQAQATRDERRLLHDHAVSAPVDIVEDDSARPAPSGKAPTNGSADPDTSVPEPAEPSPDREKAAGQKRLKGGTGEEQVKRPRKRKAKASNLPNKPHKSRVPSAPPFDPAIDPGEDLDPTVVTMATICRDTGQGRISSKAAHIQSNHAEWKALNRDKISKMKSSMQSKKYGVDNGRTLPPESSTTHTESARNSSEVGPSVTTHSSSNTQRNVPTAMDDGGNGFDYSQSLSTSRFNVQVRIGPNGETVIDEESLFVDRNEEAVTESYTHVEESDTTKFVNSGTYGKKYRGTRWSAEETELFYDVRCTENSPRISI
jgi:transcription factor TFIIIB component B''